MAKVTSFLGTADESFAAAVFELIARLCQVAGHSDAHGADLPGDRRGAPFRQS
jgi:hypothetical protein